MSFYLIPIIGAGSFIDQRRPKYLTDGQTFADFNPSPPWAMSPMVDTGIVWADTTPAQDAFLAAQLDVRAIPPLDNTIGAGALPQVKAGLEALNIPAQWVQVGMTYRTVVRVTVGMSQLIQRTEGLGDKLTIPGNLDLTMAQIPAGKRTTAQTAIDSMGLDRTQIVGSTTLREALRIIGEQFAAGRSISLGDL